MTFKSFYIIAAIGAALAFSACKKDLGDYNYTTQGIPVIDTAGIGATRYVERYSMLDINPVVAYDGGNMNALQYKWIMYKHTVGSTPVSEFRVLSNALHLQAPVTETVGEYRLELIVNDTVNKLKANMIFAVTVSVGIEYGVMVLHGTNDSSDVDFLITAEAVPVSGIIPRRLRNLYSSATGGKLPGVPRFIAQERRNGGAEPNWIMLGSDKHLSRMKGNDFSLLREDLKFFRRSESVVAPEAFMYLVSNFSALINGGKLHLYNTSYEIDALFGGTVPGDYELAPYLAYGSAAGLVAVAYDKKYGKFVHPASIAGNMIDFKAPAVGANMMFDHRNIGKDMLFMDRGYQNYTHSFFKDRTGTGYWLYISNFTKADDGNMVIGAYNMTNLPEIASAKFFQSSELGYTDLYATDRKIYAYDYQGTNTAKVVFDALPAGETITAMKIYKPRPSFSVSAADGRLLEVATWDGTQGRVYEFAFNGVSGEVTLPAKNTFTGFGKVYDITAKNRGSGAY